MDIKDLGGVGSKFNLTNNLFGHKSFQSKLGKLAIKNSQYSNLSKGNIKTIVNVLNKPEIKKAIRLKGGITDYQMRKKINPTLLKEWKAHKDTFTKEDLSDARKIVSYLSEKEQSKLREQDNKNVAPIPRQIAPSFKQSRNAVSSISQITRGLGGSMKPPTAGGLKPSVPLVR